MRRKLFYREIEKWKSDLIDFYDSMGIPYLDHGEEELLEDIETLNKVLEALDNE